MTSRLNLTRRTLMLARSIPTGVATTTRGRHWAFIATARPLQKEDEEEASEKALEAVESLKDGAKQLKETYQMVRDTTQSTLKTVTKATKEVTIMISVVTEAVKEKIKDPMDGFLTDAYTWGKAAKGFEYKMAQNIKDSVLVEEVKGIICKAKKD